MQLVFSASSVVSYSRGRTFQRICHSAKRPCPESHLFKPRKLFHQSKSLSKKLFLKENWTPRMLTRQKKWPNNTNISSWLVAKDSKNLSWRTLMKWLHWWKWLIKCSVVSLTVSFVSYWHQALTWLKNMTKVLSKRLLSNLKTWPEFHSSARASFSDNSSSWIRILWVSNPLLTIALIMRLFRASISLKR